MKKKTVLITAGEASADAHAARVIRAVRDAAPGVRFMGMGGPEMEKAGMDVLYGMDEVSVMGFTDVAVKIPGILRVYRGLKDILRTARPDLFIAVDLPDFNMRLASFARTCGVKVLYYIAPQAWAWRRSRARTLARITDGLAVIFPFEEPFFRAQGVQARYVGHPLMDHHGRPGVHEACWPPRRMGMMPGSRVEEVRRILPVMTGAKRIVSARVPGLSWHLRLARGLDRSFVEDLTDGDVTIDDAPHAVDAAMVKSGTSSLETALEGTPEVICYRTSMLNYLVARLLVSVDHIGMPNIIAGRAVVPELVQGSLTEEALAGALLAFITDESLFGAAKRALLDIRDTLGARSASQEVAGWALDLMGGA
jgi:lipid-A-disaccharide synthase